MKASPMINYIIRRMMVLVISLFLASTTLFVLLRMLPGDPANALLTVGATPEQVAAARHSVGSDLPMLQQFWNWLNDLVTFQLGTSLIGNVPVGPEINSRLSVTVPLTLISFFIAITIAVPLGFIAAYKAKTWYGALLNSVSQLGIAIPVFWVGVILILIFALRLMILPAGGFPPTGWSDPGQALRSLLLPVITIALVMSASLTRYVRSATLDVLNSDYLRTSRSLGSSFMEAMWRHGIRNAASPVVSILGMELATTFIGAVVVEAVFALPGLGSLLVQGIAQRDYPIIQGILFVSTMAVLIIGFLADLAQRFIDPRLSKSLAGRNS
ncbi:MAG: ABC transporter permease [Candidatus Nanopelagicaceae bacterium]|nr:ABC transporter permease [Candidatus Nanopelagicaceae bacterium]